MRLASFPLQPTTPQTPKISALIAPWQLHPAGICMGTEPSTLQGPAQWHQHVSPGPGTQPSAGAAPIPSSTDQSGCHQTSAQVSQALLSCCSCIPGHGWALGWTMDWWPCRSVSAGAGCGGVWLLEVGHSHFPSHTSSSLCRRWGLGHPVSPGMGTLLAWLPL